MKIYLKIILVVVFFSALSLLIALLLPITKEEENRDEHERVESKQISPLPTGTFSDFIKFDFDFDNRFLYFRDNQGKTLLYSQIEPDLFGELLNNVAVILKYDQSLRSSSSLNCFEYQKINNSDIYHLNFYGGSKIIRGELGKLVANQTDKKFLSCDQIKQTNRIPIITFQEFSSRISSGMFVPYFQGFPYNSEYQAGRYQTIILKDISLEYLISGDYLKPFFNICGIGSFVGKTPEGKDFPVTEDVCVALDAVDYDKLNEKLQSGEIKWESVAPEMLSE